MRLFSWQLVVKEFRDLVRDPRIWIPFILSAILMPAMGLVVYAPMMSAAEKAAGENLYVAVINMDKGTVATSLIDFLNKISEKSKIVVYQVNIGNISFSDNNEIKKVSEHILSVYPKVENILIFPADFSEKIYSKQRVRVYMITIVREISFIGSTVKTQRLSTILDNFVRELVLNGTGIKPSVVVSPIVEDEANYLVGKKALLLGNSIAVLTSLSLASFLIPIILMMISVTIMQMTATSMAVENEEKTLETLLTLPLTRTQILLSKLLGSFTVAAIGSFMSVVGFGLYMVIIMQPVSFASTSMSNQVNFSIQAMISPLDITYIIASLIATTFFTAALGIVVGALSSDTRIASTIIGPLSMLVFVPGMLIAFSKLSSFGNFLPLLYILPLTQPIVFVKQAISNSLPPETVFYIIASILVTIAIIIGTAKIFSLETLSNLQHRISKFRRK